MATANNSTDMFTMTGPRSELWANGAPVGTLARWKVTALSLDRFILEAEVASGGVEALANLPPFLRPPLEWRWAVTGGVMTAPVRMLNSDPLRYAGLAKPVKQQGRVS